MFSIPFDRSKDCNRELPFDRSNDCNRKLPFDRSNDCIHKQSLIQSLCSIQLTLSLKARHAWSMKVAVDRVACRKKVGKPIMQLPGVKVNTFVSSTLRLYCTCESLNTIISLVP
jgi:hypothetical protein